MEMCSPGLVIEKHEAPRIQSPRGQLSPTTIAASINSSILYLTV
jgi:hypothetical protein